MDRRDFMACNGDPCIGTEDLPCRNQADAFHLIGALADMTNRIQRPTWHSLQDWLPETPADDLLMALEITLNLGWIEGEFSTEPGCCPGYRLTAAGWATLHHVIATLPGLFTWPDLLPVTFGVTSGVSATWESEL